MRKKGSYEIVHDSDIDIDLVNEIAEINKYRFKEKGMIFEVFKNLR